VYCIRLTVNFSYYSAGFSNFHSLQNSNRFFLLTYLTISHTFPYLIPYHISYLTISHTLPYLIPYHLSYLTISHTLPYLIPYHISYLSISHTLPYLLQLVQNEDYYTDVEDDESDSDVIGLQPPKMSLHLFSEDPVDICLSKVSLLL